MNYLLSSKLLKIMNLARIYLFFTFILFFTFFSYGQEIPKVATNQCISLFKNIKCSDNTVAIEELKKLVDAKDSTVLFYSKGPVSFSLEVNAENTTSEELILHWRGDSYLGRGLSNNDHSLQQFYILTSSNSVDGMTENDGDWITYGPFTNKWQDGYVVFPNTHPKWVMVKELNDVPLKLSRLDVFTKASGDFEDDIWLFMGDSETNHSIIIGTQHDEASVYFADEIYQKTNQKYYPIVINAGKGGETAAAAAALLDGFLNKYPETTFVPFCYGLNDLIVQEPYQFAALLPYRPYWKSLKNASELFEQTYYSNMVLFQSSIRDLINISFDHGMFPIPSRMPWVFYPSIYSNHVDTTNNINNPMSTWGRNGTTPFNDSIINPIIKELTPYAFKNDSAIVDFDTRFHEQAYDPNSLSPFIQNPAIYVTDKTHFWKKGTDLFNQTWVKGAMEIVYLQQPVTVRIKDVDQHAHWTISPNPAKDYLFFTGKTSANADVVFYNIFGQAVTQFKITGNKSKWDISSLPNGIYFYRVFEAGISAASGKIIVE